MAITDAELAELLSRGYWVARSVPFIVTDAQIKTLTHVPFEVVPAPSAGKVLVPLGGFFRIHNQGHEYTNASDGANDGPNVVWQRPGGTTGILLSGAGWLFADGSEDGISTFVPVLNNGQDYLSSAEGLPLSLLYNNTGAGGADLEGGHITNYMTGAIAYTIVDVS